MGVWGLGIMMFISPLALRFRDFSQIVGFVSIVLMFFSPIFWNVGDAKNQELAQRLLLFNPIADFILAFKSLLSTGSVTNNYMTRVLIQTIVAIGFGFLCFSISRRRIPYWN
jgi:ABC-type polysaccharide/polyol phosphate export permease